MGPWMAQNMKSTYHKIQGVGRPAKFKSSNRCISAADRSILFQFGIKFEHMTPDVRYVEGQWVKGKVTA